MLGVIHTTNIIHRLSDLMVGETSNYKQLGRWFRNENLAIPDSLFAMYENKILLYVEDFRLYID